MAFDGTGQHVMTGDRRPSQARTDTAERERWEPLLALSQPLGAILRLGSRLAPIGVTAGPVATWVIQPAPTPVDQPCKE